MVAADVATESKSPLRKAYTVGLIETVNLKAQANTILNLHYETI